MLYAQLYISDAVIEPKTIKEINILILDLKEFFFFFLFLIAITYLYQIDYITINKILQEN